MLRLQLGLAFIGPDSLARFGGLLHLGLRLDDMERFLADIPVIDHPHGLLPRPFYRDDRLPLPPASAAPEPSFKIENLCREAQPEPLLRIRRRQRRRCLPCRVHL